MKKFFKSTYYTAVIVVFLMIAAAGFTQTKTFRASLRSAILAELHPSVNGTIRLGEIQGNLATGFFIDSVAIIRDGRKLFFAERLEARYDLLPFLFRHARVSRLTLLRPRIHLERAADGVWNTEGLFVASAEADTTPSSWTIDLRLVELLGARVTIVDSLALSERLPGDLPASAFDYDNLTLDPLTLKTSLRISGGQISGNIRNLDFVAEHPTFRLEQLTGAFVLSPEHAEVRRLAVRTARSRLSVNARLTGTDITTIGALRDLRETPVALSLTIDRLDFREFQQFLPGPVDFLDTYAAFDVRASGTFGQLSVDELTVRTPRSYLHLAGTLRNLHRPEDLELDVSAHDNIIHPADLLDLLPGLHLPDVRTLGVLSCDLRFRGTPEQFAAGVQGKLSAGTFTVDADLDLRGREMVYAGTVTTTDFDLGALFADRSLASRLNLAGEISGTGTSLRTMTTVARLQADSSEIFGLPVSNSVVVADVADRAVRSSFLINGGPTRVDLHLRAEMPQEDSVQYQLNGKVFSLNLAPILRDRFYESDLSFEIDLTGTSLDFASMDATVALQFLRSSFRQFQFEDRRVAVRYAAGNRPLRELVIRSDAADVHITGIFTPVSFVEVFAGASELLADALTHRLGSLDALRGVRKGSRRPFVFSGPQDSDSIHASFAVEVKDFHALGVFLGEAMAGAANLRGSAQGSLARLAVSGELEVGQFALATGSSRLDVAGANLLFDLSQIGPRRTIEHLHSSITLEAQDILLDSLRISGTSFRHDLVEDVSRFAVSGLVDSAIRVDIEGTSSFVPNLIDLSLSTLGIRVADHEFENTDTIHARYGLDGIELTNFLLQHETEEVQLAGVFDPGGTSEVRFSVRNFLLNNLSEFSRSRAYLEMVQDFNGILDLEGTFQGSFHTPEVSVSLTAQGVRVGPAVFGTITGRGSYADGLSDIFLEFRSNPDEPNVPPELFVSGVMPLNLGSASTPRRDFDIDLVLRSRGFRLEFLDPFIPVTSKLTGQVFADMKMRGTLSQPHYEGSLTIQNGRFFFTPIGITYTLNGRLQPRGQRIMLEDMTLANIPDDRVPALIDGLGSMRLTGSLLLSGLEVREFDIGAAGQLLIMKEGIRLPNLPLYGNVYIASGATPLKWTGKPERSFVTGDVLVKNASITFPPARDVFLERSSLFAVTFIDDTSRTTDPAPAGGRSLTLAGSQGPSASNGSPPAPILSTAIGSNEGSFLDNIIYSLTVETAGLTQVRFVFNQITNEELFADLKGRLVFTKDESASRLTGELEVGPRSYYKYFKTLQATGKLLFTGDVANPELEIVATYDGVYTPVDTTAEDQKVIVSLTITGTRNEPKVRMGLEVYDREGNKLPQRADVQSDAIAFLVSGTFKDEMTQQQETSLTSNLLRSIGSSLLTGPLTEFVRSQVGYVTSIDVAYYGGGRSFQESADIRVTGEVGDAVIRLGGRVFHDVSNTNLSVQFPMSAIVGSEAWRNLVLELERRVEGVESFERRRDSKGVRLLYRITF